MAGHPAGVPELVLSWHSREQVFSVRATLGTGSRCPGPARDSSVSPVLLKTSATRKKPHRSQDPFNRQSDVLCTENALVLGGRTGEALGELRGCFLEEVQAGESDRVRRRRGNG